jgi:hypothetical protein
MPGSVQLDFLQVNGTITQGNGNVVTNGFVSEKGAVTTIDGQMKLLSADAVCGGMIIRTGTTGPSTDVLCDAALMAAKLGLTIGQSASRSFAIVNMSNNPVVLGGLGWTFLTTGFDPTTVVNQYYSMMFFCVVDHFNGAWRVTCTKTGMVNND